jgi:hypothetical protein
MNRTTSHYRLIVETPGADRDVREQAISLLASALPTDVILAGSCYAQGSVEISYRASDDLQAISIAQGCLADYFATSAARITTGYGVHRRAVAEQVAR